MLMVKRVLMIVIMVQNGDNYNNEENYNGDSDKEVCHTSDNEHDEDDTKKKLEGIVIIILEI